MRDYKKRVLKTLLVLGAFFKDYKKHAWKPLLVLGVVLFVGIPKAHAAIFIPFLIAFIVGGVMDYFFIGKPGQLFLVNFVTEIAKDIIYGIAFIIDYLVTLLGRIFFWVANTTIDAATNLNALIDESFVVKEGFGVSLAIANLGLVIGFIVMAIAIMIRADWLVEARKAIPKFIAAALLINFGYFILTGLLIKPVDEVFSNVYNAAKLSIDTFGGVLSPHLNLRAITSAQLAIAKIPSDNKGFAEDVIKFRIYIEETLSPAVEKLLKEYELDVSHFDGVPPLGRDTYTYYPEGSNATTTVEYTVFVSANQRVAVRDCVASVFLMLAQDMNNRGKQDNMRSEFTKEGGWSGFFGANNSMGTSGCFTVLGEGAPYIASTDVGIAGAVIDGSENWDNPSSELGKLLLNIANTINGLIERDYDCTIWKEDGGVDYINHTGTCYSELIGAEANEDDYRSTVANMADRLGLRPTDEEMIVLALVELLFNSAFTILGAFTLLGVGLMLIYRYVALSFLIILFPFVWLGWVFPKIATVGGGKNIWNAWWGQFLRWLLFGPVAMFFVYLSARAAIGIDQLTEEPGAAWVGKGSLAVVAASAGNAAVVIGLLLGGTYVANKFGIAGSGMIMGTIKSTGKRLGKAALKYTGKTIGGAIAGTGRAALRSKTAQSTLGKLQGLAGNRGRLLRTVAAPLTGSAAKLKEAGQRGGRKAVDEHMERFKDMRSEDIIKMYSSLRTEEQRMAAFKTVAQRGDYGKWHDSAMGRDYERWSGSRMQRNERGDVVLNDDGDPVMENIAGKKQNVFEKYNQEEVLKKAKKQFFDTKSLELLREVDRLTARQREVNNDPKASQEAKDNARVAVDEIAKALRRAIEKQLSELSGQEAQIFTKNASGLLGEFKPEPEKHTAGVGNLGGAIAHDRAGDALADAIVTRPEAIRGALAYTGARARAKLMDKVQNAITTTAQEASDILSSDLNIGIPTQSRWDQYTQRGIPVRQNERADLAAELSSHANWVLSNPEAARQTATGSLATDDAKWEDTLRRLGRAASNLTSLVHSGVGQSIYATAASSAGP
jgi:hypothetical protein